MNRHPLSSRVCDRAGIRRDDRMFLLALHEAHGEDWFIASVPEIAALCGTSPESARQALRRLRHLEVVQVQPAGPQDPDVRRLDVQRIVDLARAAEYAPPTVIYRRQS